MNSKGNGAEVWRLHRLDEEEIALNPAGTKLATVYESDLDAWEGYASSLKHAEQAAARVPVLAAALAVSNPPMLTHYPECMLMGPPSNPNITAVVVWCNCGAEERQEAASAIYRAALNPTAAGSESARCPNCGEELADGQPHRTLSLRARDVCVLADDPRLGSKPARGGQE